MTKTQLQLAALFAFTAVALGAFAAHGLKAVVAPEQLTTFETGVRYQFYHAFALMGLGLLSRQNDNRYYRWAGWAFVAGIICFSGSLYLLSCREVLGISSWKWLGPVTPLGGLMFLGGWCLLLLGIRSSR